MSAIGTSREASVPLRRLFRVVNGATPSPDSANWDGGIPWATPIDVGRANGGVLSETGRTISKDGLESCAAEVAPPNSLVLSTRAPIGYVALTEIPMSINQGCRLLVPRQDVEPRFYMYVLSALTGQLSSLGRGSTFLELGTADLGNIRVPFLPLGEQRAIVRFLDEQITKIDDLLDKKRRLSALLDEHWDAELSTVLDNVATTKRLRLLVREPLAYGLGELAEGALDGIRIIRITDVDEEGSLRTDGEILVPQEKAAPYMLSEGDVLLARSGATVGKSFMYSVDWGAACYAGYLIRARLDTSEVLPAWFNYFTRSKNYWNWIRRVQIQATIPNVSAERYASLPVPLPSFREQQSLVDELDQLWDRRSRTKRKIAEWIERMAEHRSALITAAVTGQIDVGSAA